ncbi:MAG: hypothetical protein Q7W51_01645 [Coriobacteriia bacterium]|nr:hypothetical protein [Coriobacteriia bacterium]
MSLRRLLLVALSLVLALVAFGCEPAPSETPTSSEPAESPGESAEDIDPAILEGRWTVATTLTDIDNEEYRFLGDQPSAQWECAVVGPVMQMQMNDDRYSGVVESNGNDWVYEGSAAYADEDGATWTSTIVVRATQDGSDAFTGVMEGSIDSGVDGHLYTGTWELVGTRME